MTAEWAIHATTGSGLLGAVILVGGICLTPRAASFVEVVMLGQQRPYLVVQHVIRLGLRG